MVVVDFDEAAGTCVCAYRDREGSVQEVAFSAITLDIIRDHHGAPK
jgi:hypothetical protein